MSIANRLRQLRGNLTQAVFGAKIGVSQPSVKFYEKGERVPDAVTLSNICTQFGVSADWLLFGVDSRTTAQETSKSADVGNFDNYKKNQHIEIINNDKNKTADVGTFPPPEDASASLALVAMSHELMEAVKEIRALNAEKRDLQNRIAELEKNVEALTAKASTAPAASAAQKSDSANEVPTITPLASPTAPNNHVK